MASLKEYNLKLSRTKNTQKLTKTMYMVSANKLRKAQNALKRADLYYGKLIRVMKGLVLAGADLGRISVCNKRKQIKSVLVIVIASDRGLCGGFNNNLNKTVLRWLSGFGPDVTTTVYTCGKKSTIYLRNKVNIENTYDGVTVKPRFIDAQKIASDLQAAFVRAKADEVYVAYNSFKSVISQQPVIERFLPILPETFSNADGDKIQENLLMDSGYDDMFYKTIPQLMSITVFKALVTSLVGEHAARMTAMENSKNNAEKLIETITLLRNRARQAAITNELSEIISGAEALN